MSTLHCIRSWVAVALVLVIGAACGARPRVVAPVDGSRGDPAAFAAADYRTADGTPLPYRLLTPATTAKGHRYPLVVLLHGSGAIGTDNTAQLGPFATGWDAQATRARYPAYVLVPQFPARTVEYHPGDAPESGPIARPFAAARCRARAPRLPPRGAPDRYDARVRRGLLHGRLIRLAGATRPPDGLCRGRRDCRCAAGNRRPATPATRAAPLAARNGRSGEPVCRGARRVRGPAACRTPPSDVPRVPRAWTRHSVRCVGGRGVARVVVQAASVMVLHDPHARAFRRLVMSAVSPRARSWRTILQLRRASYHWLALS